jgi:hypothetical protein
VDHAGLTGIAVPDVLRDVRRLLTLRAREAQDSHFPFPASR